MFQPVSFSIISVDFSQAFRPQAFKPDECDVASAFIGKLSNSSSSAILISVWAKYFIFKGIKYL